MIGIFDKMKLEMFLIGRPELTDRTLIRGMTVTIVIADDHIEVDPNEQVRVGNNFFVVDLIEWSYGPYMYEDTHNGYYQQKFRQVRLMYVGTDLVRYSRYDIALGRAK